MGIHTLESCRKCFRLTHLRGGLCPDCHATACIPKEHTPNYRSIAIEAVEILRRIHTMQDHRVISNYRESGLYDRVVTLLSRPDVAAMKKGE